MARRKDSDSGVSGEPPGARPEVGQVFVPDLTWPRGVPPKTFLAYPRLSSGAKLLYILMAQLGRQSGRCWASEATLARGMARRERQVRRYLVELLKRRFVRRRRRSGRANLWEFRWHQIFAVSISTTPAISDHPPRSEMTGWDGQNRPGGMVRSDLPNPRITEPGNRNPRSNGPDATENGASAPAAVTAAIQRVLGKRDTVAAAQIVAGCRAVAPHWTDAEIAESLEPWLAKLAADRRVRNPLGLCIARMPARVAEELEFWRQALTDPRAGEAGRQEARHRLGLASTHKDTEKS